MKNIMIILLFLGINLVSCQELKREKMIEQFIFDLFNDSIPATNIVETYMQIELDSENELSLKERGKGVLGIIEETRKEQGLKGSWLIPNREIKHMSNFKIYPLNKFESLNKLENKWN